MFEKKSNYQNALKPKLIKLQNFEDVRGRLTSINFQEIGFSISRVFTILCFDPELSRGEHAHKSCWQFLFSEAKSFQITYKNLDATGIVNVDQGSGLLVPPWNWIRIKFKNEGDLVVVICSDIYDEDDYINSEPN